MFGHKLKHFESRDHRVKLNNLSKIVIASKQSIKHERDKYDAGLSISAPSQNTTFRDVCDTSDFWELSRKYLKSNCLHIPLVSQSVDTHNVYIFLPTACWFRDVSAFAFVSMRMSLWQKKHFGRESRLRVVLENISQTNTRECFLQAV